MKRFLSIILTCCLLLTALPMVYADSAANESYQEAWDVLKGLNIIHFDDVQKLEEITRAEFAQVLSDAFQLASEPAPVGTGSFGRPEELTSFNDNEEILDTVFADVAADHQNYAAIKAICDYGIMKGNGNGYFEPDRVLKYEEAVKTIIVLCGYETEALVKGGWFTGYHKVANNWDLMLANKAIGETLSKLELAEIIYRAFDVELKDVAYIKDGVVYYATYEGKTFLSERLGFKYAEGQLTEAENSTLSEVKSTIDETVVVDGVSLRNEGASPNNLLGRYVKAFYTDDGIKKLVYTRVSRYDDVLEIDAEDFAGYSRGVITYYDGTSKRTVNVNNNIVVYNGAVLTSYTDSFLDDFYYGTITITQNDDITKVVNIRSYKDMVITGKNDADFILVDSDNNVKLALDEEDYLVSIFNSSKEKIEFSEINTGISASYLEGSNCREVYLGALPKQGVVMEIYAGNRVITASVGDSAKDFEMTKLLAQTSLDVYIGANVNLYTNIFGKVFYIELNGAAGGLKQGVVAAISADGSVFGTGKVKMYTIEDKFEELEFASRVLVYTKASQEPTSVDGGQIDEASGLNGYRGYVTYLQNDNKQITEIRVPYDGNNQGKALKSDGDGRTIEKTIDITGQRLDWNTVNIAGTLVLDGNVKIFSIPSNPNDFDKYRVYKNTQLPHGASNSDTAYRYFGDLEAYYSDGLDPIPDALVLHDFIREEQSFPDSRIQVIVKEVWKEIDDFGKERTAAKVFRANDYLELEIYSYAEDELNGYNFFEKAPIYREAGAESDRRLTRGNLVFGIDDGGTLAAPALDYNVESGATIEPGDIITLWLHPGSTEVAELNILFDADRQNLPNGRIGYLAGPLAGVTDKYFLEWNELDSSKLARWNDGEYDTIFDLMKEHNSLSSIKIQNPIRYDLHKGEGLILRDCGYYPGGAINGFLAYVVKNTDAFMYITTQDLSVPGAVYAERGIPADFDSAVCPYCTGTCTHKGVYLERWDFLTQTNHKFTLLEFLENGSVNIRQATPADIRSYENYGSDASRVLSMPNQSRYILINDYR